MKKLTKMVEEFRDARDWKQFHNPKDCAISLSLEAAEVMEHFQWKSKEEVKEYVKTGKKEIGDELADVLFWVLLMSKDLNIDVISAFEEKMEENAKKYPIDKAKGNNLKYTAFRD
ncbi:MAG: nucleotide pyrophosphohydrolase [Parcubacteria group bacterium]|nr:nucleotide pyrophosphohydrolase [Parcubacteria group bacterium]